MAKARRPALVGAPCSSSATPAAASATWALEDGQASAPNRQRPASPALPSLLSAASDLQAVQRGIEARAGATATAKVYQHEAHRLLLWLQYESLESQGATLAQMQVTDCIASMGFLQNIPPRWISRVRASPCQSGWAPFR